MFRSTNRGRRERYFTPAGRADGTSSAAYGISRQTALPATVGGFTYQRIQLNEYLETLRR